MSDKFRFKPSDFRRKKNAPITGYFKECPILNGADMQDAEDLAEWCNAILDEHLSKCLRVYGEYDDAGMCLIRRGKTGECTHTALLMNVEEIKKDE